MNRREFIGSSILCAASGAIQPTKNEGYFPTVIEGKVESGRLVVTVYDVWRNRVAGRHEFAPRKV